MRARLFLSLALTLLVSLPAVARQGGLRVDVSSTDDFSRQVRRFEPGQTIHFRASTRAIDAVDVTSARYALTPKHGVSAVEGDLTRVDNAFVGFVHVDDLAGVSEDWVLSVELAGGRRALTGRTAIVIRGSHGGPDHADRPEVPHIEVKGPIEAVDAPLSTVTVNGVVFTITPDTRIQAERGARLTYGDLAVGMMAKIVGTETSGGSLVARLVHVEVEFERDDVHTAGPIEALGETSVQVAGEVYQVTQDTRIANREGVEIGMADLAVGMIVRIKGFEGDSGLTAVEVTVLVALHAEAALDGPFTGRSDGMVEIAGVPFSIDALTRVQRNMSVADLQPGVRMEVRFSQLSDGSLRALRLRGRSDRQQGRDPVRAFGVLQEGTETRLVVSGVSFLVTAGTRWIDAAGADVGQADVPMGVRVRVWASWESATGLTALKVAMSEPVEIQAEVTGRGADFVGLAGREIRWTGDTEFVDQEGRPTDPSGVGPGTFVAVLAVDDTAGKGASSAGRTAEQVMILSSTSAASAEPAEPPVRFELAQNYPNPFNPQTSIRFALSAPSRVTVAIYTLLGQRVRTLLSGTVQAGTTTVTWDARDDRGADVASGVYLYRVASDGHSEARAMTLIR